MLALGLLGVAAPQGSGQAATGAVTASAVAPFDLLPAGPPPRTVPYAIGQRVFYGGQVHDFHYLMGTAREFAAVTAPRPGTVFTQFYSTDSWPMVSTLGVFGSSLPYRVLNVRSVRTSQEYGLIAATSGGLVTQVDPITAYSSRGWYAEFPYAGAVPVGNCWDFPYRCESVRAVGGKFFVSLSSGGAVSNYLWYPGWPLYRLPGDYEALLGPTGWVGLRNTSKVECLRIASADRPLALGPRLCSQAVPLISSDGRRAILVQAGRVRVYDAWSGWQMGVAQLPAITWSPGRREVHPVAWESADSYLVNARYDGALALVRCSVSTNRCQRVVRSYVRDGVSGIVTLDGD